MARPSLRKVEQSEGRFLVSPAPVAKNIEPAPAVPGAPEPADEYIEPALAVSDLWSQRLPCWNAGGSGRVHRATARVGLAGARGPILPATVV